MILLSARAGEESRVEGLEAGADDYLVKPFSARELLARVDAHLEMNRLRREAARRERALLEETRAAKERLETVLREHQRRVHRPRPRLALRDGQRSRLRKHGDEPGRDPGPVHLGPLSRYDRDAIRDGIAPRHHRAEAVGLRVLLSGARRWYENRLYPSADGLSIFFTEVTERRRTEEALRESEARFRNMADNAPVGVWVTDPAGRCTYVNEWWCRFTGTAPEQSLGFGWLESVHPDDRRQAEATFRAANDRRGMFRVEYRVRGHDGDYRRVIDSAAPRLGPSGEYLGYIGSVIDVTEERRREEALRRSEEMLAEAQQIAHIGSWSWDLESNEITWSDEHYRIVGLRPQEAPMTAERAASYIHWEDRAIAWESVRRAIRERQPYEWCLRMVREDGRSSSRSRGVGRSTTRPARPCGCSARSRTSPSASGSRRRCTRDAMVLANVSDSVIATDLEGIITFWNEGATRLFGWTAAEMVGRPYADRFPEPERSWIVEQVRSRAAGTEWVGEYQDYYRDGTRVWIDARVRRVTDAAGRPHGIIGIARDITERKRAEEQLAADLAGMRRLQEVSTQLVRDGDSSALLGEIMDAAIAITAADMGTVQLLDADSGTLRLVASRGFEPRDLKSFGIVHEGECSCGTAMQRRERVVIEDVTTSPVLAGKPSRDSLLAAGIRAAQSTPLFSRSGDLVGMLFDALPRAAPPRRPGPERHGPAGPTGRRLDRAGPGR